MHALPLHRAVHSVSVLLSRRLHLNVQSHNVADCWRTNDGLEQHIPLHARQHMCEIQPHRCETLNLSFVQSLLQVAITFYTARIFVYLAKKSNRSMVEGVGWTTTMTMMMPGGYRIYHRGKRICRSNVLIILDYRAYQCLYDGETTN